MIPYTTRTRRRRSCAGSAGETTWKLPGPKEGKIELKAACDGLFRVDVERLNAINEIDQVMIATRRSHTPVKKGGKS